MRKAISTIVVACALIAVAAGIADAASTNVKSNVATKKCNTTYTPRCTKPHIKNHAVSPQCVNTGIPFKLPVITFTSNSGIRRIQVLVGKRRIENKSFKGQGRSQFKLKTLHIPTVDLLAGKHSVLVKVTDIRGKTVKKTLNFSVCQAKPEFTG